MTGSVPQIFDRRRLAAQRTRAAAGFAAHDFLLRHIGEDLATRLSLQKKQFECALCLGSSGGLLRHALHETTQITYLIDADLTAAMLPENGPRLVLDEEALPFADSSFDLVIAHWGLHHVNDLPGTLVQIRRALKPDGLFIAALPGSQTLSALRQAFVQAESDLTGRATPHIHPFAELRDLGGLLQRTGFALPVADAEIVPVRYASPLTLLADLRGMGEANILTQRARHGLRRDVLMRALACFTQATQSTQCDGKTIANFEICYLAGWAHHDSQQQPLRPGSATTRLADALNTREEKL